MPRPGVANASSAAAKQTTSALTSASPAPEGLRPLSLGLGQTKQQSPNGPNVHAETFFLRMRVTHAACQRAFGSLPACPCNVASQPAGVWRAAIAASPDRARVASLSAASAAARSGAAIAAIACHLGQHGRNTN